MAKSVRFPRILRGALCAALVACSASAATDETGPLPMAAAQSQGFSPARLERVTRYLQTAIDQGHYAGAVTLVARRGRIVQWQGLGYRDIARNGAMAPDAIFQIYSMTKPITSVAALLLMEEGRLGLEDPLSRYLPEFARMQVLEGATADSARTRPAARPITIKHMGTRQAEMTAGDTVSIPTGVRHNARNIGTEDAVLAISFSSAYREVIGE